MKNIMRSIAAALACTSLVSSAVLLPAAPAAAIPVFDASNYAQNVLTAARTLQQINQQIQSLQNEATMILSMDKNLKSLGIDKIREITGALTRIDQLMGQAQGVGFKLDTVEQRLRQLYPDSFEAALTRVDSVRNARARLDASKKALEQSLKTQARIVTDVREDMTALGEIVGASQSAEGALQVGQATNQLLALTAKQQIQIQMMMAAEYQAAGLDRARRLQSEAEGRARTKKFLGNGRAYTPAQ
ncbi:P-type conjugative transfer protein TrbJ [Sphingomonas colocasiae]|uniref:P-type conjugative transfer protein TrbJ n=1 Tax=Sphingomonas colocasiae TaxID=1848973 RepID=A0ABS7PIF5_9SPHN|nr:P-type conjugative transfer protein TrbJ [Sphingomonas colocasiae]MBY8821080.1 P-type conjugative transfer protein TrbJ [Sphingomonas colocasiae]